MKKTVPQRLTKSQRQHLRAMGIPTTIKGITEQIAFMKALRQRNNWQLSSICPECIDIARRLKIPTD